jgi:hypothetical protein
MEIQHSNYCFLRALRNHDNNSVALLIDAALHYASISAVSENGCKEFSLLPAQKLYRHEDIFSVVHFSPCWRRKNYKALINHFGCSGTIDLKNTLRIIG